MLSLLVLGRIAKDTTVRFCIGSLVDERYFACENWLTGFRSFCVGIIHVLSEMVDVVEAVLVSNMERIDVCSRSAA